MKHIKLFEQFTKENKNWLIQPEPLHPNLSKKNLAKLKKLGHTGMKSAILWTDGHSSNPTYIQMPGEDGIPWGSKGPEDRTIFYWDGENVWCTNYPKETLRIDYKKSVDTAKEFSDATKSISDSGKWEKVEKMQEQFLNEAKVDKKYFDKVVKVLSKSKYPFTIMLVTKWNEIDIIIGNYAPDYIVDDIDQKLTKAGMTYGGGSGISISGDSSNFSRREYDEIARINGGHKNY